MNEKFVITIGRQFGSGGRELGKRIAEKMGIAYYDKELLLQAARQAGLSPEFFENNDERAPRFINGLFTFNAGLSPTAWYSAPSSISDDIIYKTQSDFIHNLAAQESCVIVGRSADYILRDMPNVISIFVHAPIENCVDRIVQRSERKSRDEARNLAVKTNKLRANYYNFYTDKRWGDAKSYHLSLDSSLMPIDDLADLVIEYTKLRLKNHKS